MTAPTAERRDVSPAELLRLVQEASEELRPGAAQALGLDDSLAEAGIDSLARAQLLVRLEQRFAVRLPDDAGLRATTPRELLRAISAATGGELAATAPDRALAAAAGGVDAPGQARTLLEALDHHAERHPDRQHLVFDRDEGAPFEGLSYRELRDASRRAAAGLQAAGVQPDEAVALMLPTGRDYFVAFFGVLRCGAVPLPLYPPSDPRALEAHLRRQQKVLASAGAVAIVTDAQLARLARLVQTSLAGERTIATVAELEAAPGAPGPVERRAEDVALLQYTSGSTGDPKGVVLTHANLLANIRAMGQAARIDARSDVIVSWLPLYHDMGLIGTWLGGLYHGVPVVILSPLAFLARPQRWLEAIHRHRGTISAGPNFAYHLCATALDDAAVAGLDLSSWRMALNGSEPVSPATLAAFARRFAPAGLRPEALLPAYGLAECAVGLCFPPLGRGPRIDRLRRDELARSGQAVPAAPGATDALEVVGCGLPLPGHEVRVVAESGHECREREVGRVEMRGPSMTGGYRGNEAATRALLRGDGWLDTGDCGYLLEGELFLTGRQKDIIIRAGRKLYPSELEAAVLELPGVCHGGAAVFASRSADGVGERLVVVAETTLAADDAVGRDALRKAIEAAALRCLQLAADEVVLVAPRAVPRTANGKVRRAACRELWEQGRLGEGASSVRVQLARLALASAGGRLRQGLGRLAAACYSGWVWLVVGLLAGPGIVAALVLPTLRLRRAVVRGLARLAFLLAGVPLDVRGRRLLPRRSCVVVAHHASYVDSILLFAALPPRFAFVAKRELASSPVLGLALARLGVLFVERKEAHGALEDAERLTATLRRGDSLALFPEGTFERAPGLLPFHLGGFVASASVGAPVVPTGIRGTRTLLRGDAGRFRWTRLVVTITPPIQPAGGGWEDALVLRDLARAVIARESGDTAGQVLPPDPTRDRRRT